MHSAVCKFLKLQYPDCMFTSESSGIRLTIGQAVKAKGLRSESKLPDLMILEPRGGYCGLFIELKKESVFLKNGRLSRDKHTQAQAAVLDRLKRKGYHAVFGCGLDKTINLIDTYMKSPLLLKKDEVEGSVIDEWYKSNG